MMTIIGVLTAVWGIAAAAFLLYLNHRSSRSDPESKFANTWERLKWSVVGSQVFGAVLMLIGFLLAGFARVFTLIDAITSHFPIFTAILFGVCWLVAPKLMDVLPATFFSNRDRRGPPKPRTLPHELTKTELGVMNLDANAYAPAEHERDLNP